MTYQLHHGNCLDIMPMIERESIDAIVTDPPYGLGFMGKDWDHGVPGEHFWREAYRVAKPGAFLLAFGGDRTHHRLMVAIEDAGWEIRTCIYWLFGQGFPKSHDVSKDLRDMPTCSCGIAKIPRQVGCVDSALPSKFIGAGIGTESASMLLTGLSTNETSGLIPESSSGALGRVGEMQGGIKQASGQPDPVVFGALDVAGIAKGDQVGEHIGIIKPNPESLRNQVMSNEIDHASAIDTSTVPADNALGDGRPLAPLVSPSAVSPSGVSITLESNPVINSHAIPGTVDGLGGLSSDGLSAGLTDESIHESDYTTERQALQVCDRCGKIIADSIPDGLGTALKPAAEIIIVARRPLQGTVAENVQRYGTGAINIDGCRVGMSQDDYDFIVKTARPNSAGQEHIGAVMNRPPNPTVNVSTLGRWPSNLVHDGSAEVLAGFPMTTQNGYRNNPSTNKTTWFGANDGSHIEGERGFSDTGSAARFFYCAKASKQDRDEGLEGFDVGSTQKYGTIRTNRGNGYEDESKARNHHPTVKPTALMRYLCRLVTPPGGIILDPFMGSGSTGKAAILEGFNFVGIDTEKEYIEIAARRIEHACGKMGIVIDQPMLIESRREMTEKPKQMILL